MAVLDSCKPESGSFTFVAASRAAAGSRSVRSCSLIGKRFPLGDVIPEDCSKTGPATAGAEPAVFPEAEGSPDDSASAGLFLPLRYLLAPLERRRRPPRRPRAVDREGEEVVLSTAPSFASPDSWVSLAP